jgi:hypothetical protein
MEDDAFSSLLKLLSGSSSSFDMEPASTQDEATFSTIEDLQPGDHLRKVFDDGKKFPKIGDVARVFRVIDPPIQKIENSNILRYDFSILMKSYDEDDDTTFAEFAFDSRFFRKTNV